MNRKNSTRPQRSPMKAMSLISASKKLEGICFDETHEMTPSERVDWQRAQRGPGRPRKPSAEKAARVLVTLAPELLAAADAYAVQQGISRAELVARSLSAVLSNAHAKRPMV